jgi:4'-phosphopantetheinyl transferase
MRKPDVRPWEPGPLRPPLGEGTVHVWRANLDTVSGEVTELLSGDERARAERMLNAGKAQRWSRARGVLRELLGRYLDRDPGTLCFRTGAHGKPALAGRRAGHNAASDAASPEHPRLSFNMSHSGQLALYAFAGSGAVGVDVEVARPTGSEVAIADRLFGLAEALRFQAMDPGTREREFLRMWTRHEAVVKCRGISIEAKAMRSCRGEPWIAELEVGASSAAAVALSDRPHRLSCWGWRA